VTVFKLCPTTCPSCGHAFEVDISFGLDGKRQRNVRERLMAGTYQVYPCPACKVTAVYESPMIYTDFERGEYVAMETARSAAKQTALARHETIFRDCFECGPPIAQELGARVKRRIVYGFGALREKLRLWDAGLDDRIVEAVKGDLVDQEGYHPATVMLRLAALLDGGHLMFGIYPPIDPPEDLPPDKPWVAPPSPALDFVTAPAAMYQSRSAEPSKLERDFPWIGDDWLVDVHDGPSYLYR